MIRDISDYTEMAQLHAALQEWQAKFSVIYHDSPDGIMIVDSQNQTILDLNQTAEQLLGYQKMALIGAQFSSLFPQDNGMAGNSVDDVRIHGVAVEGQNFVRANGSVCPMDLTYNFIPWHGDNQIMITLRDVTARVLQEAAQQKLIEELDAFAHTVAHDLKAPLTTLIGAGTTFDEFGDALPPEDQQNLIQIMTISGQKMRNIIDELLLLAEMRDKTVEMVPIDMARIVNGVETRLAYVINRQNVTLVKPKTWPTALGYEPWIEEVLANYVSNAIKYGGQPPLVELGATVETDLICFWVKDNGAGLTKEQQGKLFTPFTQLNVRAQGQGLGLSIVQRIVERLNGRVSVESTPGQGSIFSFILPATDLTDCPSDNRPALSI